MSSSADSRPITEPAAPAEAQLLCPSTALAERGTAWVWDVLQYGQPARAFALRFDGQVRAYLNRCVHVPAEMDWLPGEFLDSDKRWILCSIHGASYEPANGRCVGGPCGRGSLVPIQTLEADGRVLWQPTRDIRPAGSGAPPPSLFTPIHSAD
jgi:nitrite reductase/ring-hydroxylating ferredoxin subunit